MADSERDAKGPIDQRGRPLMPRPEWVGPDVTPPTPEPKPEPERPKPEPERPKPEPPPADGLTFPSGSVKTIAPNSTRPYGFPWTQVSRWEPLYTRAGEEFGVAPLLLAAFSIIESNANHYTTGKREGTRAEVVTRASDAFDRVPAVGMMQIKLGYHDPGDRFNAWTPEGNLRLGAKLLAQWITSEGSWEAALRNKYFPGDDAGSGISQTEYIRAVRDLIVEVKASWPDIPKPPVSPHPPPIGNPYPVAGLSRTVTLPFPLHVRLMPASKVNQRPGRLMVPNRYVQHDTGNRTRGANAAMHMRYLFNGAEGQQLGYHFAVDDREAYQMIPVNEIAWHAGDGSGPCNMRGLSCELAINSDIDVPRSRENAAILAAELMNALGIETLSKHQDCSGKLCPQSLLNEPNGWTKWTARVRALQRDRAR